MKTLNVKFDAVTSSRFPVFCWYKGQHTPQPAFISLDIETGEVDAAHSGEIGNGVPADVFHNRRLRFPISEKMSAEQIAQTIRDCSGFFQRVLNGSSVEWNGNNYVGVFDEDANECFDAIEDLTMDMEYRGPIELNEWLDSQPFPGSNQTIEDFAQEILDLDGVDGMYLIRDYSLAETLDLLRDYWADLLYSGHDIPSEVARYLLVHGTCDDSKWMIELREFADVTE